MVDVRIKPLEWSTGWGVDKAETPIGHYFMEARRDGAFDVRLENVWNTWASTSDAAKAAAQADYERRILATLSDAVAEREAEPVDEEGVIDQLRLKAFATNSPADRDAYFNACSKWFQDRHYRRLAPPTSELEALRRERDESARVWRKYGDDMHQRAMTAEARVAELEKALMIANANLDNMEFLSVEGFMDWQQEYRTRRVREGGKNG